MQRPEIEHICVVCGEKFTRHAHYAKYCDKCKYEAVLKRVRTYSWQKRHGTYSDVTRYTCIRCGRKIIAHGICANRMVCNECVFNDTILRNNTRKDVFEEVEE